MNQTMIGCLARFAVAITLSLISISAHAFNLSSTEYHNSNFPDPNLAPARKFADSGIKEIVPKEFLSGYQKWKAELLSTDYGRDLWNKYFQSDSFLLTIRVSSSRKGGAGTGDFEWDKDGNLIAATISLGKDLDKGVPDPVYYPVMNSLSSTRGNYSMSGEILAATKMAHEIGHVTFTAELNGQVFRNQNRLMESYYNIFLKNGFNTRDPRLVALEGELGARPLHIWEDREYWSEVSAMRYLVQRIEEESYYCAVLSKIKVNVASHAYRYKDRFDLPSISATGQRCAG